MAQVREEMDASFRAQIESIKKAVLREEAHNVITLLLEMCVHETALEAHEPQKHADSLSEEGCLGLMKLVESQINRSKEEEIRLDLLRQGGFKVMKEISYSVWKNNSNVCRAVIAVLVFMAGTGWSDLWDFKKKPCQDPYEFIFLCVS